MSNVIKAKDMVNHPPHYTNGGIECIDAINSATTGLDGMESYCTGTAIKYLWRWKHKNGIEDLNKAKWYINRLIKEIEKTEVYRSSDLDGENQ